MRRQVPFCIEDPDLGRAPEASLRATVVTGFVVPADLHLPLDLALLSQDHEVRKLERLPGSTGHRLRHVLGRREPFLRVKRHGPRHDIRKLLGDAGLEVAGGSEEFGFTGRELLHRSLGVFGGEEEEEDRTHAVQIARRRRLPQVLLRGPPTRCVDDGSGPGELVELLLRRPEVEEDDLSAGVEDDVLGLHIPVDHVPRVKVRQRLEELEDVSSGRRRVGRLVLVQLRQRLALELFLDEAERSEVGAFVHISDDPWMTRGLEGLQDLGFDPKPFLGLGQIEAAGLFHDDGLTAVGLAEINGRHPSFRHLADDFVAALPTFQGAGKGEGHTVRRPYLTTNCSVTSSATSISSSFWSSVRPVPVTRMREAPRTNHVLFVLGFRCTRGFGLAGIRAEHRIDGARVLVRRSDRGFVLGRHRNELQFRRFGFGLDLRAAGVAEPRAFPVLAIARRTLGHVHHRFGFFFPMIVVACRKSFLAASVSWRPLRATVAWASRIVVATSLRVGFARIAVAAPASVAILRMMVSAFWSAVASLDCTARCMRTVASAELSRVRGYGFVSALDSLGSSVKLTLTSCVTSTKEKRISVAFPAGLAGTPIRNTSVCSSPAIRSRSGTV